MVRLSRAKLRAHRSLTTNPIDSIDRPNGPSVALKLRDLWEASPTPIPLTIPSYRALGVAPYCRDTKPRFLSPSR